MFGSYQAGVWSELAAEWKPDLVVGASVGSLNGYLIASGCPAAEIESRWLTLRAKLRWRVPDHPADGIIDAADLTRMLQQVCSDYRPLLPLGVVATKLESLTPTLFQGPAIQWEHLGASCAVPLFLKHYRFDGALYSDGGLLDPLPLWAAVEMGATRIVAVNVMEHRPLPVRVAVRALNRLSRFRSSPLRDIEVIRIAPTRSLGPPTHSVYWDSRRAARWIGLGKEDARKVKHLVVECLEHKEP